MDLQSRSILNFVTFLPFSPVLCNQSVDRFDQVFFIGWRHPLDVQVVDTVAGNLIDSDLYCTTRSPHTFSKRRFLTRLVSIFGIRLRSVISKNPSP